MLGDNAEALQVFERCLDQWQYPAMGGPPIGMPNTEIESVMRIFSVKNRAECFDKVKLITCEIVKILQRKENAESR